MNRTTPSGAGCPAAIAFDMAVDIASTTPSPTTVLRTPPARDAAADPDRFALFRMFPLLRRVTRKTGGVTRRSRRLSAGNHFRESGPDNIWDKS
ncbi:hypothetical protein OH687_24735 [Burkholderia anthina]|nr:hypothetical protein OH687_24735 [Burkholderia anthina]